MKRECLAFVGLVLLHGGTAPGPGAPRRRPAAEAGREPAKAGAKAPAFKEEVTVESASKVASNLIDAPATMSVVTSRDPRGPARPEHGRHSCARVPGLNVIQTSARDINLTSRQATSTLATSQLVMVDGRSVYLDFFGLVLWDFVPRRPRARSSRSRWCAARRRSSGAPTRVNGVVNIITKTPRENEGFGLVLGGGLFNRDGGSREADGQRLPVQRQLLLRQRHQRHVVVPPDRGLLQLRPVLAPRGHGAPRLPSPAASSPAATATGSGGAGRLPDRRRRLTRGRRPAGGLREQRDQPAEVRPAPRPGAVRRQRGPA